MSRGTTDKAHWLDALRRYKKAEGVLCNVGAEEGEPGYCCLGVLAAEDEVLRIEGGWRVEFLDVDLDEDGDPVGEVWRTPSDAGEEYHGHPKLDHQVQSLLIRANDCTDRFDTVVIPLIETLLNDDLSLKAEHQHSSRQNTHMGVFVSSLSDFDRTLFFTQLVAELQRGTSLIAAFEALSGQGADEMEEVTDD